MEEENKKIKIFFRQANRQGSILAFSLIIMFVLMIIAAGVATVSVKERKMSSDTGKSIIAYQAADSGAEIALEKIIGLSWTVNDFDANMGCSVIGGEATVIASAPSGEYNLTFEDAGGLVSVCSGAGAMNPITKIKSLGKYSGINRAVEVDL
ncbi:pilus assembly PilX N-terminal domain-containing protein [bacterium]|nr:pilus assembly PilX N-terminal domain-containing protein [bacterium]